MGFCKFCLKRCKKIYCCENCRGKDRYRKTKGQLKYYHKNKKVVLPKQIEYKRLRYINDINFKKKDDIRKRASHRISLKNKLCNKCKSNKDLQRHHPNYKYPLKVVILCRKCHNKLHKSSS